MDDDDEYRPYEVGYGRPPIEHQFKKGAPSANPLGRPRRSKNRTTYLCEIANEKRRYAEQGRQREDTTLALVILAVRTAAAKGDAAGQKLFDWLSGFIEPEGGELIPKGVLILGEEPTHEEWLEIYGGS